MSAKFSTAAGLFHPFGFGAADCSVAVNHAGGVGKLQVGDGERE
ncbi:hypothetical protein [Corynebacterium halotolerans]